MLLVSHYGNRLKLYIITWPNNTGIVDVEIELYSSDDTGDTGDDTGDEYDDEYEYEDDEQSDNEAEKSAVSEKTFSYSAEKPANNEIIISDHNKVHDINKSDTSDSGFVDNKVVEMEDVTPHTPEYDNSNKSISEQIEYSLVDPEDDIFSENFSHTDTIERIKIVMGEELPSLKTQDTSTLVDSRGTLVDAGVGDYSFVDCQDTATETQCGMIRVDSRGVETSTSPIPFISTSLINMMEHIPRKEEEVLRRREEEEVSALLEDLEITEEDIERKYTNKPTICIETGVEKEGAPLLRLHKVSSAAHHFLDCILQCTLQLVLIVI